jgi:hypothetical protein
MVDKFAPLVKRQIEYWQQQIEYYPPGHPRHRPQKAAVYRDLVRDFSKLLDHLNAEEGTDLQPEAPTPTPRRAMRGAPGFEHTVRHDPAPAPPPAPKVAPQRIDELADLPPELLAELSGGARAETDPLVQIINSRGGTATLDEILIDLWRNFKEIGKRTQIGNKLYRLGRRELVWSVPGKKGVYTTTKPPAAVSIAVTTVLSDNDTSESDEGPDAATSGPSIETGAAGSPVGPTKSAPKGPIPFASTPIRRKLLSESSIPTLWSEKKEDHR